MKAFKATIVNECPNIGTIDPVEEIFSTSGHDLINKIARLVFADKTHKHYWLISEEPRNQIAEMLGIKIDRNSFVWFE